MGLKEEALAIVEQLVKKLIEENSDKAVLAVVAELKKLIPGNYEDGILDAQVAPLTAALKKFLLEQAEKIS